MIDGIIQQVIKKHRKNECSCRHATHDLIAIEQELIEKIKQESSQDTPYYESMITRMKLIGDNQE